MVEEGRKQEYKREIHLYIPVKETRTVVREKRYGNKGEIDTKWNESIKPIKENG